MNDEELIKEYRKLKNVGDICREFNIDHSNIIKATTSKENKHLVAKEIIKEVMKMYGLVQLYLGDNNEF